MALYLVDNNLPYYLSPWNNPDFIHQRDINSRAPDHSIWEYAQNNNLTILTKDRDFSDRILLSDPPPRIIHFKISNLRLRDFHVFISEHWEEIVSMSQTHKLVYVFLDRIEGIG